MVSGVNNNNNNNNKNHNNNKTKNKENYPYDDDEDDYDYEEYTDLQENKMDEIDPNELGDLLQDTCNKMPTQDQIKESQESHNQQMISESESEEEFDPEEKEYHEGENIEEEDQQLTMTPSEVQATITRSGYVSFIPARYQHIQAKTETMKEYTMDNARVSANTICHANYTFIQTYSLNAGIKKFGEQGGKAALDEMKQIHDRVVLHPIKSTICQKQKESMR